MVGPSKDGSYDYASSLTDVKVTRVDRLNASFARNTGVRLASGDIIAFIDDDAIATPTWLEELVRVFEAEGPTCGGVAGLGRQREWAGTAGPGDEQHAQRSR